MNAVADPGFAKGEGGADHNERAEREPKRVSGAEPPAGPWWGVRRPCLPPPKLIAFLSIFIQNVAKI